MLKKGMLHEVDIKEFLQPWLKFRLSKDVGNRE